MSCCNPSDSEGVNQSLAHSCCPACQLTGQPVDRITPEHTLKSPFRTQISADSDYLFCENPVCGTVYFSEDGTQTFTTEQLINRVTCKDPSPDTPLCYCFKITKGDAMREFQKSGESSVIKQIEQKMAEKSCFCDKSNPRGVCCTTEIRTWLIDQAIAIEAERSASPDSCCGSCC